MKEKAEMSRQICRLICVPKSKKKVRLKKPKKVVEGRSKKYKKDENGAEMPSLDPQKLPSELKVS